MYSEKQPQLTNMNVGVTVSAISLLARISVTYPELKFLILCLAILTNMTGDLSFFCLFVSVSNYVRVSRKKLK